MLTKRDIEQLEAKFATKEDLKAFATKTELQELKTELKNELLGFKDEILSEIIKLREDIQVTIGYRDMIKDHEVRITKLETSKSN